MEDRFTVGPGDQKLTPDPSTVFAGTRPKPVTRAQARAAIDTFLLVGGSNHSAVSGTLWVLVEWSRVTGRRIHIQHEKGAGYRVVLVKPMNYMLKNK